MQYINEGERQGFHKKVSKARWYDLGKRKPCDIIWIRTPYNKHAVFLNKLGLAVIDHVEIMPYQNPEFYCAMLNSTLYALLREGGIYGRSTLGLGTLKTEVIDIKRLPVIGIQKLQKRKELIKNLTKTFNKLSRRSIKTIYEEIGANSPEEVSLDKVKPDRRELDKIIMGDILGLTEGEQLEVYRAVVKLVKDRIEKAKSVEKKGKVKGPDPEKLAEGILREIDISDLKRFPDVYIKDISDLEIIEVPKGTPEVGSDLHGFFVKVDGERIDCDSAEEAEYIYYATMDGSTKVEIPKDKRIVKKSVKEYKKAFKSVESRVNRHLVRFIPDRKLRKKVETEIWKRIRNRSKSV